ncbi:hypothetical protein VNO77_19624 [Canavalia gladiata]|uniref:Uncharacterized protein n=1 Tax=Canavalia gladiata TaxID=3824 RepID=A0AAN9QPT2_CANGL
MEKKTKGEIAEVAEKGQGKKRKKTKKQKDRMEREERQRETRHNRKIKTRRKRSWAILGVVSCQRWGNLCGEVATPSLANREKEESDPTIEASRNRGRVWKWSLELSTSQAHESPKPSIDASFPTAVFAYLNIVYHRRDWGGRHNRVGFVLGVAITGAVTLVLYLKGEFTGRESRRIG